MRAWLLLMLLVPAPSAFAQANECRVPDSLPRPRAEGADHSEPRRVLPIGGYTLALSWAPENCRRHREDRFQCGIPGQFGFTLHGLWPDGTGPQWPQYCRAAALVPERVIRATLCATPSVQLIQHEYAKHGTCTGLPPERYFAAATRLYRAIRYPDMRQLAYRRDLTVRGFTQAFAAANRGIMPNMVRIQANARGWLEEVWICLGTDLRPRRCPATQGSAASGARLRIERRDGGAG